MVETCAVLLVKDETKLSLFVDKVRELKNEFVDENIELGPKSRDKMIKNFLGVEKPDVVEIQNPPMLRNKGCGRDKRLKSARETAIEQSNKPKRKCGRCKIMTNEHDKRNCLKMEQIKKKTGSKESSVECSKDDYKKKCKK